MHLIHNILNLKLGLILIDGCIKTHKFRESIGTLLELAVLTLLLFAISRLLGIPVADSHCLYCYF